MEYYTPIRMLKPTGPEFNRPQRPHYLLHFCRIVTITL